MFPFTAPVEKPMDSVDKSAVAAARAANSPRVRLSAWWATLQVRAWLAWAKACPPGLRSALVPGWSVLFPFLYHWVRCKREQRSSYARQFLADMSGPTSRALVRGRSLTRMLQLVENGATGSFDPFLPDASPPMDVQDLFRVKNPAASEEAKPFEPGPPKPTRYELDHEGKFQKEHRLPDGSLVEDGEKSMMARHARQRETYEAALAAWHEAVRLDEEEMTTKPITWRKVAADTVAMWSAMGLLPPDVIE